MGHTAKDCPKSQKRRDKGRNQSKPAQVKNSLKEPVKSGSSKSGSSASSSHLRDLREQLDFLKRTFTPSVVSGEGTVSSQPTSPPVVVVEAVPVATSSSPGVRQPEAVASLQQDSFEFSLEVPPADTVVPSSSSGWSQQFHRSVRCKGNDSLEIVVPSSASCLGPNNNTNNKHTNKLTKSTSPHTKAGGTSNKSNTSSKQAKPAAKSLSKLARGVGAKSVRASSSSSSASEDEDNIPLRRRSKKLRKMSLPPTLSSGVPPSGVAQVLPSPAVTPAPAEVMEEDIDACLAGDSVVDPVVVQESVPAVAVAEPHAAPALMDEASVPTQAVVVDDNASSQDCPSWPFSSPQSELGSYLDNSLAFLQDGFLGSLFEEFSDVGASSTCTSSGDQAGADRLEEFLLDLPAGTTASDVEPPLPQH